jgi:cation diffusion facilitator family transporter
VPAHTPKTPTTSEGAALWGIVANAVLALVKLLGGIFGNSFALVADAVESLADIAGSVVVWGALKYGSTPADDNHPFGHGKVESLAALAVSILIIIAGLGIGIQSVREILDPGQAPLPFTLLILVAVVVVKEAMFRIASRAARRSASAAGRADAWHHRSDALTSLAAFVGISIAILGGPTYAVADDWAALAASVVIVINGVLLSREPFAELMDHATPEIASHCERVVRSIDGVRSIERCHARKSGRVYRVVMHAEVDPEMSVAAAHALTGKAKALVRHELPSVASLLIHIEPTPPPTHPQSTPPTPTPRAGTAPA